MSVDIPTQTERDDRIAKFLSAEREAAIADLAWVMSTIQGRRFVDMLRRDTSGLERALSDAGLKTDAGSLSFNLRGGNQEQGKEHAFASSHYTKAIPEEEEILPVNVIHRSYVVNLAEGLDIKI